MNNSPDSVLISADRIKDRIADLAEQINKRYKGHDLVVVSVLKGSVIFLSDLVREISDDVNVFLDFMAVSSYGDSTKTSGIVKINKDLDMSIKDKDVLIVEDIVDTGLTLSYIKKLFEERSPRSVSVCVLLDKKEKREIDVNIDYTGFVIPDTFVVGYGLDFAGKWRNLPAIMQIEENQSDSSINNRSN